MKADPRIVTSLQTSCQLLAHISAQYQVDVRQLKAMDLDWLACRVKKWYGHSEHHLRLFIDALLYFGEDPSYNAGTVTGSSDVQALLNRDHDAVYSAFGQLCQFRTEAWNTQADDIPDLYEHAIQELKSQLVKMERELKLIGELGIEEYVSARLEDA